MPLPHYAIVMSHMKTMSIMKIRMITSFIAVLLMWSACEKTLELKAVSEEEDNTLVIKVAVVMPEAQQERWERTAQWALAGIDVAQTALDRQVSLAIEWQD